MHLSKGDRLGPYEILGPPIGVGGMGAVYKARDTRLDRTVAVKVSKAEFSQRFEREAKAVAALNHPNICQLYDVGPNYLVMEFIKGSPVAPTDDIPTLLDQAMQMADGMAAAHAAGISHRDLKPGNILVTRDGRVKILDFGLAQVETDASSSDKGADADATLTMALTDPGTAIGTVAYMSPEQARGLKVDARSDLWSLGVILYEIATRVRPFQGVTPPVVFEGILSKPFVPVRERNPNIPPELDRIIARLLEKDRETRYQSAADVRADLKRVERDSGATVASTPVVAPPPNHWLKYSLAAGALVLIAGGLLWWQTAPPKPLLTDKDVLVLADFENSTGDTAFDGALRQALAFELEQSPFLRIMDDEEMNETLHLMEHPVGERLTNDIAKEVCVRQGQKATIGGSIASLGSNFQIALQAINCQTGVTLAREVAQAEDKEHVVNAVAKAATGMRAKLGESLASIQKLTRPTDVTTTSLEALKAYERGVESNVQGLPGEGIPHLLRAVEKDPNFASGHLLLTVLYGNVGEEALAVASVRKAFALIDRVSERERLTISFWYYWLASPDLNKARDFAQANVRVYPRYWGGHHNLWLVYGQLGEYEKSLEEGQEAARLKSSVLTLRNLAQSYLFLDRFEVAKSTYEQALARNPDLPVTHARLLRTAYLQDDEASQQRELQWLSAKPEIEESLNYQALHATIHGQRDRAKQLWLRALQLQLRVGSGNARQPARTEAQAIARDEAGTDALFGICEPAQKEKLNTVLCPDAAAERLRQEKAAKNPPPNPDTAPLLFRRGKAALEAGKWPEAAAEFQKIVDHKGRYWGSYYATAHLFLARAQARSGDTAKAKRAYQDFLTLWKNADKDLPFYIQAKKELAELR